MQFRKPEKKRKLLGLCWQRREKTELSLLKYTHLPNIIYIPIEGKLWIRDNSTPKKTI